ncbi:MAG: hypothetical protein ABIQ04_00255 [Candidatus Saccharimonadales bacterium]
MKRTVATVAAWIEMVILFFVEVKFIEVFEVVSADKYGGTVPNRPRELTVEVARQEALIFGLLFMTLILVLVLTVAYAASQKNATRKALG